MKIIALLLVVACTARNDLIQLTRQREDCFDFQREYNSLKPLKPTKPIELKIAECKEQGFWSDHAEAKP